MRTLLLPRRSICSIEGRVKGMECCIEGRVKGMECCIKKGEGYGML